MFDLEQAITNWRRQMRAAGIQSPSQLDELESHLREDVQQQIKAGLSGQAAFQTSIQRIGPANALNTEFGKTRGLAGKRELWMANFVTYGAAAGACWIFLLGARVLLHPGMNPMSRILGLSAVAVAFIAILGGRVLQRFFPALSDQKTRTIIKIGCLIPAVVWFPVFAVTLPLLDYNQISIEALFVAVLWTAALLPISYRLWKGFDSAPLKQSPAIS